MSLGLHSNGAGPGGTRSARRRPSSDYPWPSLIPHLLRTSPSAHRGDASGRLADGLLRRVFTGVTPRYLGVAQALTQCQAKPILLSDSSSVGILWVAELWDKRPAATCDFPDILPPRCVIPSPDDALLARHAAAVNSGC